MIKRPAAEAWKAVSRRGTSPRHRSYRAHERWQESLRTEDDMRVKETLNSAAFSHERASVSYLRQVGYDVALEVSRPCLYKLITTGPKTRQVHEASCWGVF